MEHNVYEISDLTFSYGRHEVLKKLNLNIHEGKITTLIGANGCGKSTLFNLLTKNLVPDSGTIRLNGAELGAIKRRDFARQVAIVHQYNTAPSDLSVQRLVGYGRTPYQRMGMVSNVREDEEKVHWAMEITNTAKLADKSAEELSGGQKQRVWIAMALAQDTKLLFLDEPTTYLDIRYQLEILKLIRRLNREFGLTIVMVLHDINQSLYYSDEIVAMKDGHVAAQGIPGEVITSELMRTVYDVDLKISYLDSRPYILPI